MKFQTRSVAGGTNHHTTFSAAWNLYKQSLVGEDEESLMLEEMKEEMFPGCPDYVRLGMIWKISFDEIIEQKHPPGESNNKPSKYQPHRWVRSTMSELLTPEIEENQTHYLKHHEEETKQKGISFMMEEILRLRIQIMSRLNETFAFKMVNQEIDDQVFWVDQPLDSIKYSCENGFLRILDVLTENEFMLRYLDPPSA